jgi:hypothetical protein
MIVHCRERLEVEKNRGVEIRGMRYSGNNAMQNYVDNNLVPHHKFKVLVPQPTTGLCRPVKEDCKRSCFVAFLIKETGGFVFP